MFKRQPKIDREHGFYPLDRRDERPRYALLLAEIGLCALAVLGALTAANWAAALIAGAL